MRADLTRVFSGWNKKRNWNAPLLKPPYKIIAPFANRFGFGFDKIVVETRRNNPPCYWFRLMPPFTRFAYTVYENVRDFLAPCSFSKPSRIHSTANHFPSSKSSLFSLDCECTHRPLLLLLVIFGEKSSAMKKKKIVVSKTPRPHQVRKEAHFWLFPAITRCDGWRSDLFCGAYRKRRETQKQLRIRKKKREWWGSARKEHPRHVW